MGRINRAIELLAQDQPVYYTGVGHDPRDRGYEGGKKMAGTWADFINYEMEHGPFDVAALSEFMRGLVDAGPTRSGHRTPAVICTLPTDATDEYVMRANAWMIKQVLATGIHGVLLCAAETPGAVRAFVEGARYSFQKQGVGEREGLGVGRRGNGGQRHAAGVWGVSVHDYLAKAEPWPLNPDGELLLGVKIENLRALANCEATLRVPGLAFAEWGPGDMGMSFGYADNHDPPYPPEMWAARNRVFAAVKASGIKFLEAVSPENVADRIDEGVRICAGSSGLAAAEIGRKHSGRTMPV
ncbi:MAG: aldolase/citrate lyase family protein [Chloroflexota bacterium]